MNSKKLSESEKERDLIYNLVIFKNIDILIKADILYYLSNCIILLEVL